MTRKLRPGINYNRLDKGSVSSGTVTFDRRVSVAQKLTVTGAITLALAGFTVGTFCDLTVELVNGGSSAITISGINWVLPTTGAFTSSLSTYLTAAGRSPATLQTTGTDFLYFWNDKAGNIYGKIL